MKGRNIGQCAATRLAHKGEAILLCAETGFWIADEKSKREIPPTAYKWMPSYNLDEMKEG